MKIKGAGGGGVSEEEAWGEGWHWGDVCGGGGLDGPIRANRFADSRESPDSRESFQGSGTQPLCRESRFGGLKLATGKYGCTEVRVYPAECSEQLGRDP